MYMYVCAPFKLNTCSCEILHSISLQIIPTVDSLIKNIIEKFLLGNRNVHADAFQDDKFKVQGQKLRSAKGHL